MSLLLIRNDNQYAGWIEALTSLKTDFPVVTPSTLENPEEVKMILCWKAPRGSFKGYPNLQVIGSMGAGVDHLFQENSLPSQVTITRTVDERLAMDMREFVLSLVLRHIRNLDTYQRKQNEEKWEKYSYRSAMDVHVGIMGLGTLGQHVARTLNVIGFRVSGWSKSKKNLDGVLSYSEHELDSFLANAEILICLLPLTDETRGILDISLFDKLPHGAYLINVARGGHLYESDLLKALDSEQLSGAALDVFESEPLPEEHPFWHHKKIFVTPHVASISNPFSIAPQIIENYRRMEEGSELQHIVSRKDFY